METTQKKSSPDSAAEEFQPSSFVVQADQAEVAAQSKAPPTEVPQTRFSLSDSLWQSVVTDPDLRASLWTRMREELKEEAEKALGEARKQIEEQARQEGLKKGFEEALSKTADLQKTWESLVASFIEERHQLLRMHEKSWAEALRTLCRKFLLESHKPTADEAIRWLNDAVVRFPSEAKVRVRVSSTQFSVFHEALSGKTHERWVVVEDATLPSGSVACDIEAGGLIFNPEEQLKSLESKVENQILEKAA